jgi:phospholipid/cholesterol/gamma-HCH transport system substrate-binding protein
MDNIKVFELKVGMFILVGIFILVFIIFSIGDINLSKVGYPMTVTFNFAAGLGTSAPVRLAGVGVGRVDGIRVMYNEKEKKTYAEVHTWIQEGAKIEKDSVVTINTLGLLGEKYLEILPGTPGSPILEKDGTLTGKDPVMMEQVTDNLVKITDSVNVIVDRLKKGEGTIGKLLTDDKVYNNLDTLLGRLAGFSENFDSFAANLKGFSEKLNSNQGTVQKLLTEDKIYKDLESFVSDIKAHPWKLLSRGRE